jgi:hypothetical protein
VWENDWKTKKEPEFSPRPEQKKNVFVRFREPQRLRGRNWKKKLLRLLPNQSKKEFFERLVATVVQQKNQRKLMKKWNSFLVRYPTQAKK